MTAQPKSTSEHAYELWTELPASEASLGQVKAALESRLIEFERELRDKIADDIERRGEGFITSTRRAYRDAAQVARG